MMSSVADEQEDAEDMSLDQDSTMRHERTVMVQEGYDFAAAQKETRNTYQFGPLQSNLVTIDASLARLFQCMSLAYQGGKVVSPKWKHFKGLKLTVKDKIRLNNAIWRTWHIQYIMQKKKGQSLIQFATPIEADCNTHARPEAVVLEGKYWKRKIETVVAEYKKWRKFYLTKTASEKNALAIIKEWTTDMEPVNVQDELFMSEFTDTLFTSLSQQPFQFPHPREIAQHATNSDMIQPGLLQLQPIMDDFMDFDPLQDLLFSPKRTVENSNQSVELFTENAFDNVVIDQNMSQLTPRAAANGQAPRSNPHLQFPSKKFDLVSGTGVLQSAVSTPIVNHSKAIQPTFAATFPALQNHQTFHGNNKVYILPAAEMPQQSSHIGQVGTAMAKVSSGLQTLGNMQTSTIPRNVPTNAIVPQQVQVISSLMSDPQNHSGVVMQQNQPFPAGIDIVPKNSQEIPPSNQALGYSAVPRKRVHNAQNVVGNHASLGQDFQKPLPGKIPTSYSTVPAKRRSVDEGKLISVRDQQPTLTRRSSYSDVDMENTVSDESSSFHDSDISQMESLAKLNSFSSEQKRRVNIKYSFSRLQNLIPGANLQASTKISRANLMNKTVQHIKTLQADRRKTSEEIESLKEDIRQLQQGITSSISQLPATGIQVSAARASRDREKFNTWCRQRTRQDWKFFLFSAVIEPWFDSYQRNVSVSSQNEFVQTLSTWLQEHCSLIVLRRNVVHSLQNLSTTTSIINNPSQVQQHIEEQSRYQTSS